MYVIKISKHSPEDCPGFNEKNKEIFLAAKAKGESLAAKHRVKIVGAWVDMINHTAYSIYDVPRLEDLLEYFTEPVMMEVISFQTSEIRILKTGKEVAEMIG
jgi:hypothetical protein